MRMLPARPGWSRRFVHKPRPTGIAPRHWTITRVQRVDGALVHGPAVPLNGRAVRTRAWAKWQRAAALIGGWD